jgi:hypothetical protein
MRTIKESRLVTGGFSEPPSSPQPQDSTARAIMPPAKLDLTSPLLDPARACLQAEQLNDGRLSIPKAEMVFWPTPIVLPSPGTIQNDSARHKTARWALYSKLQEYMGKGIPIFQPPHDPSITGWPCSERTRSFGEPTSLTLLALDLAGLSSHSRFQERFGMLMDRQ